MKRILKIVGSIAIAILGTLWALASCDIIRIPDFQNLRLYTLGEYAVTKIEQKQLEGKVDSPYSTYIDPDLKIAFKHPSFIEMKADVKKDRDPSGNLLTLTYLHGQSTSNPILGIFVVMISDPFLASQPDWYPPADDFLRAQAFFYLSGLTFEKSEENKRLFWDATQNASMMKIAGFPAAAYEVEIDDKNIGQVYMRGASIISPKHHTDIIVIGASEPDAPDSLNKEQINKVWNELSSSMILPE